jgi:hypothetical protein
MPPATDPVSFALMWGPHHHGDELRVMLATAPTGLSRQWIANSLQTLMHERPEDATSIEGVLARLRPRILSQCPRKVGPLKKADKQLDDQNKFKQTWNIPFYLQKKDQESGFVQEQRTIEEDALAWEMLEQEKFQMDLYASRASKKSVGNSNARARGLAEMNTSQRKKKFSPPVISNSKSLELLGL